MVFWAIHKLYASKHISRGKVVVTTHHTGKSFPGKPHGKKVKKARPAPPYGCCHRRVKVEKGKREADAAEHLSNV